MKLLDSSPACDAGRLHRERPRTMRTVRGPFLFGVLGVYNDTVHLGVGRTKASDFEFVFAALRRLCWNLLYACVRHLGASEGG